MEVTIKINEKTKAGKTFKSLLELFVQEHKGVEIISRKDTYNSEFVKMVQKRVSEDKFVAIETESIWESI
jgi:uncharacterized lipoprotein YehR (DUF1307 family)